MPDRPTKLFMGVGNILRHDDGIGVFAARVMSRVTHDGSLEVCDAGTAGPESGRFLERRQHVVIADAIDAGAEPGTVFRMTPDELRPLVNSRLSLHDAHWLTALDETRLLGTAPRDVVVLAAQIADTSLGIGLSASVRRSISTIIRLATIELGLAQENLRATVAPFTETTHAPIETELMPWS